MSAYQTVASRVAAAAPNVGFNVLPIITTLLPALLQCFKRDVEPEADDDPREFIRAHYDERTGEFDRAILRRVRPQTHRAVTEHGKERRLKRSDIDAISAETLRQAMNATDEELNEVYNFEVQGEE